MNFDTAAKKFFKNYDNGSFIKDMHHAICDEIWIFTPPFKSRVFEFGCGNGKILKLLKEKYILDCEVSGCDISENAIELGKSWGLNIWLGDENELTKFKDKEFDVLFTCSVLDHIEDIEKIIKEFKRVSKSQVIAETNSVFNKSIHYYPHEYEIYGFYKIKGSWDDFGDGCTYHIWSK